MLQGLWIDVHRQGGICQDPCLVLGCSERAWLWCASLVGLVVVPGEGHVYVWALLGVSAKRGSEHPEISRDPQPSHSQGVLSPAACPGLSAQPWLKQSPRGRCWDGTRLVPRLEGRGGRGSRCSRGQLRRMWSCGGDGEGSQPPVPSSRAGAEGAQQPLFLRMKACPRTACSISMKAMSPTVTAQGPSARNPHFW